MSAHGVYVKTVLARKSASNITYFYTFQAALIPDRHSAVSRFMFFTCTCYFDCISVFTLIIMATCSALGIPGRCTHKDKKKNKALLNLNGHHLGYVEEGTRLLTKFFFKTAVVGSWNCCEPYKSK